MNEFAGWAAFYVTVIINLIFLGYFGGWIKKAIINLEKDVIDLKSNKPSPRPCPDFLRHIVEYSEFKIRLEDKMDKMIIDIASIKQALKIKE